MVKQTYAIGVHEAEFESVAEAFLRDGREPVDVRNFSKWWEKHRYYERKPALKTLLQELSNAIDVEPVKNREWWE